MIRTVFAAAAALMSTACVTDPAKIAITPKSSGGMIVMAIEPTATPYTISIKSYSKSEDRLTGDYKGFYVEPSADRQVMAVEAAPGAYVFQDVRQQVVWAVCFHDDSLAFDVSPGEVVYLGAFDGAVNLDQLRALAVASGRTSANGVTLHNFLEGIKPPALAPVDEAGLGAARAYLARTSPLVTSPVRAAQLEPARFGAGKDLFGVQDSCGGWHTGSAKPKS